jgi:hypothetical protein
MEGGGANDNVECAPEGQEKEIAGKEIQAIAKIRRQMLARRLQHILRKVDPDDASAWQGIKQLGSEASSAAAGVENSFISTKLQASRTFLPQLT